MLASEIRAVAFDAGGTLLFPHPPAAVVYAEVGRRHGSRLTPEVIGPRFAAAFARQDQADSELGYRTHERREEERWRRIVAEVLEDVRDPEPCFRELYAHYARPDAWRCPDDTADVLEELSRCGYRLAMASNYDHRLHAVVAGRPELRRIGQVVISAEVGWRKPAPEFFAALRRKVGCAPAETLFVGDDPANDYAGARAAGLRPVLYDPHGEHADVPGRIASLGRLLADDSLWPCTE